MFVMFALVTIVTFSLFASGCAQTQNPAASPSSTPSASGQPPTTNTQTPSAGQTPPPEAGQPQTPPAPTPTAADFCPGLSGNELLNCTSARAKASDDITICTALSVQADRYNCISAWCGSEVRDYSQCAKLTDYDDRTGCLNKCNPNANT